MKMPKFNCKKCINFHLTMTLYVYEPLQVYSLGVEPSNLKIWEYIPKYLPVGNSQH